MPASYRPAAGATGTLALESQAPDGHWSTFARYRMRRTDGAPE